MTKKKMFSRLALAMIMALACTSFTSCGDDTDEQNSPATWSSSYEVKFELSDDVMNTADITAYIANPDGTFSEEKVTKSKLSWTLTGDKLPNKAGVLLTFVPKKNIDKNKVYDITINGGITVTSYRNKGVVNHKGESGNSEMTIKGDKLAQHYVGRGVGFAYGLSENGAIVSVDVDSFDFGLNVLWKNIAGWIKDVLNVNSKWLQKSKD